MNENPMHDLEAFEGPTITIENHQFNPQALQVEEGEDIKVVNNEPNRHTLTSSQGDFDVDVDAGNETEFTVPPVGEYEYYCKEFPEMKGKIVVKESL